MTADRAPAVGGRRPSAPLALRGLIVAALLAAFAVGLSALVAVVLSRYVSVPAWGPFPAMYEPVWFARKTLSAVAEAVAAGAAALALMRLRQRPLNA